MKTNWLIIGAGYTGAVLAERLASQLDQQVVVVDKRDHIGGNAYDFHNEQGILIHKYGPHIFHTNSERIWKYLSQFTAWRPYQHEVLAVVEGKRIPVPFNLNSLEILFPKTMCERLERSLLEAYGFGVKVPILKMLESTQSEIRELASYVYKNVFEQYTLKQWGLSPEQLDASVTGRVPVFISRDNRYFQDTYQAMPRLGYTELFRRMLNHPNIRFLLKTDYRDIQNEIKFDRMIFTGAIDEFFGYSHGHLPYRSLRFDAQHEEVNSFQEVAQVNYPNDYEFTRIVEYKKLGGELRSGSTVVYEYPEAHEPGKNTPYYPIPRQENRLKYEAYLKEAERLKGHVIFAGRLADYKYYNMDQAVGRALKVFEDIKAGEMPVVCGPESVAA